MALAWWSHDPVGSLWFSYRQEPVSLQDNGWEDTFISQPENCALPQFKPASCEHLGMRLEFRNDPTEDEPPFHFEFQVGPHVNANAQNRITLPSGQILRVIGYATWDMSRDVHAAPAYFDAEGRAQPAAEFLLRHGLKPIYQCGQPFGLTVFIEAPDRAQFKLHTGFLRPRSATEPYVDQFMTGNTALDFEYAPGSRTLALSVGPSVPNHLPQELRALLYYGEPREIPLPTQDGRISRTETALIHRITTTAHRIQSFAFKDGCETAELDLHTLERWAVFQVPYYYQSRLT